MTARSHQCINSQTRRTDFQQSSCGRQVISIQGTSEETTRRMLEFGAAMGKTTVNCKDTPGFIVNRLLVPNLLEAVRMLERGELFCGNYQRCFVCCVCWLFVLRSLDTCLY